MTQEEGVATLRKLRVVGLPAVVTGSRKALKIFFGS